MASQWLVWFLSGCLIFANALVSSEPGKLAPYIIQMDRSAKPSLYSSHLEWYLSNLQYVLRDDDSRVAERILYSYDTVFHGIAALLSEDEVEELQALDEVVNIFPDVLYQLHTTRSPSFLGLDAVDATDILSQSSGEHDVTVGILDTGIWPESESFNDSGMPPVPVHWKGICEAGRAFDKTHCNKKIVGARVFYKGYEAINGMINELEEFKSPRDQDGHGTHTAATVAGSPVRDANLLGYALGTARGMAPGARVAAYKVCWSGGCSSLDIIAAVDRAVADGVDVLSISLGGGVSSYYRDALSVSGFGAMEKGVFVSCSAGNSGPDEGSLTNLSPWTATVGASSIDRDFPANVVLGTGYVVHGVSLYHSQRNWSAVQQYPLVYFGGNATGFSPAALCLEGTLTPAMVAGKIVICDRGISPRVQKGVVAKAAGAVGMVLCNSRTNGEELVADSHLLPAVAVGEKEGKLIKQYAQSRRVATASLGFLGTRLGTKPSPTVAAFSSRGPNMLTLDILKPDFVAPGVNILAAWTGAKGPSNLAEDKRKVKFNILSGTSMSCPHVSGIAAFLKGRHPDWSPAAIKSALMTTAYVHDNMQRAILDSSVFVPATSFDYGAGHVNPVKALDPGLVYDIEAQDYFEFLCKQNLSPFQLAVFSKHANRTCNNSLAAGGDLNYPAISAVFPARKSISVVTLHRTVTNVGSPVSTYSAVVSQFKSVTVRVEPSTLSFTSKFQKLSFKVIFTSTSSQTTTEFGGLVWRDGVHKVRSPIVVSKMESI